MKNTLRFAAAMVAALSFASSTAFCADNLVISEFMAANSSTLADEDGQYSDWIEIYNAGNTTVNLDRWSLTDNAGNRTKWRFPATNLPPFNYLVVFASGNNRAVAGAPLHTNFRLDGGGEYLALVDANTNVVSAYIPQYPNQRTDVSYGLGMVPSPTTFFVPAGSVARYLVPTADIGTAWTGVVFNDAAWMSGATGLGYDTGTNYASAIATDIGLQLTNINSSAYVRLPFTVSDPAQLQELKLRMRYDDGFIAYLNGTEVARANAPTSAVWNSQALVSHGSDPGLVAKLEADFDTVTNAFTPSQQGVAPGPVIAAANAGSTGKFLRLLNDTVNGQVNSIAFNQTAPGTYPVITANFDFRVTDAAGDPADGFAFMLIPTSTYGTSGVGVNPVGGVEEPNFPGVFAIGFDLYPHGTQNDVSAHWNGAEKFNITIPRATLELVSGTFHRLQMTLTYVPGGAKVTLVVTPNVNATPGVPYPVVNNFFIEGLPQFSCRAQFAGRTGGSDMSVDFDNINLQFGYPGGMVPSEEFNLSSMISLLTPGNNVLAIHGLNLSPTNADFLLAPELLGRSVGLQTNQIFLTAATPGAVNSGGAAEVLPPAVFSISGGVYASSQTVALSSTVPGAIIRYSMNGAAPTEESPAYTGPISVTNSTALRTRVFATGFFPSDVKTEEYTLLNSNLAGFTSTLPLLIVDGFNQAITADMNPKALCNLTVIDVDAATGRSSFSGRLNFQGRAGIEGHGQSSWGFNKKSMNIEIRDEYDRDKKVSILDMPAGSDWVLLTVWNDKTFLNDIMAYEFHEEMGHYAVRRRFVEVFWNGPYPGVVQGAAPTGDTVGTNDYVGIYLLLEKIRIDDNRVNITQLQPEDVTEPDVTGGYIWKLDKPSPGDWPFVTPQEPYNPGASFRFHEPKAEDLAPAQRNWLTNYLVAAENVLYGPNWLDPINGYRSHFDVESFVDLHWIVEFPKQIDGYRLSSYFQKDRGGKIKWTPIWDWNLSFGNANYLEGGKTQGWYYPLINSAEHIWERRMIQDLEYNQRLVDRWGELRTTVFSLDHVLGTIDSYTNLLNEPKDRDFARFPRLGTYLWPNPNGSAGGWDVDYQNPTTYAGIIGELKKWITGRFTWIDRQIVRAPILSRYGGSISVPLNMLAPTGTVYYTLDGSDPRLPGGSVSPNALVYTNSVILPVNARVVARAFLSATNVMTAWSPPARADFGYPTPTLAITEIMYHPAPVPPGSASYQADEFEYIEFANTGVDAIDLAGLRLADGVDFTFASGPLSQVGTPTTNGFDTGGTAHASRTLSDGPGATTQSGGPSGNFLNLVARDTGTNRNRIAFDQTATGSYDRVVAEFDFRGTNFSALPPSDIPTVQNFDSAGSTYWLRNFDAADTNTPGLMTDGSGPSGNYIRITKSIGNESGGLYFDATEAVANSVVLVNFDFRCQGSADGFGFAFLPTSTFGVTGTNNVPAFSEEPNIAGAIGLGFDIYNNANPPTDYNANHVSLHWNGAMVSAPPANPNLSLTAGVFHRAQIAIKFEASRALVTVKISPDIFGAGGPAETLFNNFVINGATAYRGRVAFAGRTGGAFANQDIDNVSVQYLPSDLPAPGGISMQLLPASTFGTSGVGSSLANFTDAPAASNIFAVNLDMHVVTNVNDANVYWNGTQVGSVTVPATVLNFDAGVFHHARLELVRSASDSIANLTIHPDVHGAGGSPITVFSNLLVKGYSPGNARIEFAGRSGGQNLRADIDNVNVVFERNSPNLLAAGARILVVKNRAAFESRYGIGLPIAGEYLGNLDNAGERLLLQGRYGEPILDFTYNDAWLPVTDGSGFALVMTNPALPANAWNDPANWKSGASANGSPGAVDPAPPVFAPVFISEALSRSDPVTVPGIQDYIELHNPGATSADVSYWYLTDNFDLPKKYRIPASTVIAAGGHAVIYESAFNSPGNGTNAFALRAEGESVYVFSGDAAGNLTGWFHGFDFGSAVPNVSFGRVVKSTGEDDFVAQTARTPGAANSGPIIGPVVVTEVMYHPRDYAGGVDNQDHEFIELRNISGAPVQLFDSSHPGNTWTLRDAVDYSFPTNTVLAPGAYVLIVSFDPVADVTRRASFLSRYGLTGTETILGPYSGKLDNSADSVELTMPSAPDPTSGNVERILVDKVRYQGNSPWPAAADGAGFSLHRIQQAQYGNDVGNWAAGAATPAGAYAAGAAPFITGQPVSQTNNLGSKVTFEVTATGPGTLRYQWRFNGANITGATNRTLILASAQFAQSGEYQVVVLNETGSVVSNPAMLVCNSIFQFIAQPVGFMVAGSTNLTNFGYTTNASAVFNATAWGSGAVGYQWRFKGVPIPGANGASLTVTNITLAQQGNYDVVATDAFGAIASQTAFLGVLIKPVIVVWPSSQTNVAGATTTFAMQIRGSPPPFQYRLNRGSTGVITNYSDSTNHVFTYGPLTAADTATFRLVVTNAALANPAAADTRQFNLSVQADADGDGLPDPWEVANGYPTNDASNAVADYDADGHTLRQEYIAGTDPSNAVSVLRFDAVALGAGGGLQFFALSNRTYSVQFKESPSVPWWSNLQQIVVVPTNRTAVVNDPGATNSPQRIYRIAVPAQP